MQNFADAHLPIIDGAITAPTDGGTEAFVDAEDIAAVAAETLLAPEAHAGAKYEPTGPQALTVADAWIGGAIAAGLVPADYAVMLRWLTGAIISGDGTTPNDDVEKVTGQAPATFRDFARRNAHAWTTPAAG
ncbi:hypothetical protein ABZ357_25825 [Streptomyces sp. NPDC005917]|uniref:hypothetical protein n=1 Tax=unclassified Streptomyces TaxID=2593676 RepID=UPI0033C5B9AC